MEFEDLNRFFADGSDLNILGVDQNITFTGRFIVEQPKVLFEIPYLFKWLEGSAGYSFNFSITGFAILTIILFVATYFVVDKIVDFIWKKLSLEKQGNTKRSEK